MGEKTGCVHYMDEWGNYHSILQQGDDVLVKYSYFYGRAPRESFSATVITIDGLVYEFYTIGESTESFCREYGMLSDKLMQEILKEVEREARRGKIRFEVNEENLAKAESNIKTFVEKLKQAYYCNAYPYYLATFDLCHK
jgi:hypothetical protein